MDASHPRSGPPGRTSGSGTCHSTFCRQQFHANRGVKSSITAPGSLVEIRGRLALHASRRRPRCSGTPAAGNASRSPRPLAKRQTALGKVYSMIEQAFGIVDARRAGPGSTNCRSAQRPLSPSSAPKPVEPIALEPDGGPLRPEAQPRIRAAPVPASPWPRATVSGRQHFQTIRLYRLDG